MRIIEDEIYVKLHSSAELTCEINHITEIPKFIFWLRNGRRINTLTSSQFLQTLTVSEKSQEKTVKVKLKIPNVLKQHSGNYTCQPVGISSDSITLHVSNGKYSTENFDQMTIFFEKKQNANVKNGIVLVVKNISATQQIFKYSSDI